MLNLVLSSVAAQFISRPRQARVQLLSVSEKTEMVPGVSGGSDESCCAHWLLVLWAPTVEKDMKEEGEGLLCMSSSPKETCDNEDLVSWFQLPRSHATSLWEAWHTRPRPSPGPSWFWESPLRCPGGCFPGDHNRPHRTLPAFHSGPKSFGVIWRSDSGEGQGRGEGETCPCTLKDAP